MDDAQNISVNMIEYVEIHQEIFKDRSSITCDGDYYVLTDPETNKKISFCFKKLEEQ